MTVVKPLLFAALLWGGCTHAESPISASQKAQVEALSQRGVSAYREKRFAEAIGYFQRAYRVFPEPKLLYNIARAAERQGSFEVAQTHYQTLLNDPATPEPLRVKAAAQLKSVVHARALADRAQARSVPIQPPAVSPPSAPPSAAPATLGSVAAPVEPQSTSRAATWTLLGLGTAVVVAGGIVYAGGVSEHQKIDDAKHDGVGSLTRAQAIALRDDGADQKLLGVGLLAVGGAALTAAAVLFLSEPDDSQAAWRVGPTVGGAMLEGQF